MMNSSTRSIVLLLSCLVATTHGFFQTAAKKASAKVSPFAQEAIDIYGAKYSYDRAPRQDSFFDSISRVGVPTTDIDGTKVLKQTENSGKRITDRTEKDVAATFNAIASIYGEERAIEMVKIFPICLSFDPDAFSGTFDIWSEIFGEEETQDMVSRNPGLLAIQSKDAGKNTDNTMAFSYIVAATRPIGIFGPVGILGLLSVPVIEGTTGIAIKQPFFEALGSIF
mmetsp:Transcript_16637/g.45772  ORF Transcript_16637/g.45772 Transcript_16637/m.45772 type:complete len:225 (-) Transcript_16637:393-1067(-)|eukprot:CAMPEP_0172372896 /NCGR_PEP_ID=MMETSP1060-20121228/49577_1 /TAXON_ID=37318 /ORGANISM="Pseudo-nitzschia pungens, Strain cf. cingulata" /LENGTH=224 /DNA_ID=CAMNT_0013099043 /DNA_START=57 /DNA_END=731 /DNA_ORIENTATION=+